MISLELRNLKALKSAFDPKAVDNALTRAVKTASDRVRTQISRDVRATYNIKAGDIGKAVRVRQLRQADVPTGMLVYTGGRLSLAKFGARPKKIGKRKGVTVQVRKGSGRSLVKGAFLGAGVNSQSQIIFQRIGQDRLPIRKLTGPAIPTMVSQREIVDKASDMAAEILRREFARQMSLLVEGR
jgi:hypothetical protein